MPKLSETQLAEFTGFARNTVRSRLDGIEHEIGAHRARLYDSKIALAKLYGVAGEDGAEAITAQEASRQLTIARKQQIDLEMEVTRGERWPKDDVEAIHEAALSNVAGLLKAHEGKPLSSDLIKDIFTELREVPAHLAKL